MSEVPDAPSPTWRKVTCLSLRRRCHPDSLPTDDVSPQSSPSFADDYMAMKRQLIGRPTFAAELVKRQHFTELDLRTDFASSK